MMQAYNMTRGSWLATEVGLAHTFLTRFRGLLGKTGLAPSEGLWIKPCDSIHTLGMRFAIDAVFLDRRGRVVKAVEQLRPGRLVFPLATAVSVLELAAGTVARTGTTVGDLISITECQSGTVSELESERVDGWETGAEPPYTHTPTQPSGGQP